MEVLTKIIDRKLFERIEKIVTDELSNTNYYRIPVYTVYSDMMSLKVGAIIIQLSVYPNPEKEYL